MRLRAALGWTAAVVGLSLAGCTSPSRANIELRKDKQALERQVEELKAQRLADLARIEGLEKRAGTVPTLSEARLEPLFTAHRVEIGRLTGGADLDPNRPGDEGFRVYFTPVDEAGEPLKATGDLEIQAFDLSVSPPLLLGQSRYDAAGMKPLLRSFGPIHAFVAECPWERMPDHEKVSLRIKFKDGLTDREFEVLHLVEVKLGGSTTRPTTRVDGTSKE